MSQISDNAMMVDIQFRKKLNELLDLKKSLEDEIKSSKNPITESENKKAIQKINELIGKIRYGALDDLDVLENREAESIKKSINKLIGV